MTGDMESPTRTPHAPRTPGHGGPARRFGMSLGPGQLYTVVGLLIGAAIMLVVATLSDVAGTQVPVLSGLAAAPVPNDQRPLAERTPPPATAGTCLSWERSDAADAVVIDCAKQHLFEQAGPVQLADYKPGTPLPDNQKFRDLVNQQCTPMVTKYLSGKYDPAGAFRAGALKPSAKSWKDGDRTLRCGLQRFSRSGALYAISGKVADQDQADIRPPGTCLGIDNKFIGDPIDCSLPHAEESVGAVDLGQKFSKFPAPGDQDGFLQPACSKLASGYAGGDNVVGDKHLVVIWSNLAPESWTAGTRKVACNLAAVLPDKSGYAPIVGSVKGPVQVGDKPAPPAQPQVPPGAPAPGAGSDDDAGDDQGSDNSKADDAKRDDQGPIPTSAPAPVPLPENPLEHRPGGGDGPLDHRPGGGGGPLEHRPDGGGGGLLGGGRPG